MKIIITDNQLKKIKKTVLKEGIDDSQSASNILNFFKNFKGDKSTDEKTSDSNIGISGEPVKLNLRNNEDFKKYAEICQLFVSKYKNPLQITGDMLANGAKSAFLKTGNYVPPELALSQLLMEGGLTGNQNSRPIRTKNPFNVGNIDSGSNVIHNDVQSGINAYYNLISTKYLSDGKKVSDLLNNFVNLSGNRYASSKSYESKLSRISNDVLSISNRVINNMA